MVSPVSAFSRPALLIGSAGRLGMAFPLRLGLQPELCLPPQPQLLRLARSKTTLAVAATACTATHGRPSRPLWLSASSYARSDGHSHNQSSSSRIWYLAAAAPLMTLPPDLSQSTDAPLSRSSSYSGYGLPLNPEFVTEISRGSVIGFLIGLLVSTFSKTLVLLLGAAITLQSLAARVGIDLAHHLKLQERVKSSRILSSLADHTAFKLAFGITFALSAFMHF